MYPKISIDISKYPDSGYIIAYLRDKVIFKSYDDKDSIMKMVENTEILELHAFDKDKEVRVLVSSSKHFPNGYIESVIDFAEEPDTVYRQLIEIDNQYEIKGKLCVLNHIDYNDVGMAVVDNYRMYVEEG